MGPSKISLCFVIFFSLMIHTAFACTLDQNNCAFDVRCASSNIDIDSNYIRATQETRHCFEDIIDGYLPIHLFLENYIDFEHLPLHFIDNDVAHLIVSLDMSYFGLESTPPLADMTNLKSLNYSNNYLQTAHLFNNHKLSGLQTLDLSHNYIHDIEVDQNMYLYSNLRTLNLSYNNLTYISEGIFESFKSIEHLDLSHNNIAVIDGYSFEGLKNLKHLYLSKNNISDINSSFFRFSTLEELYLNNNNIEHLFKRDFEKLTKLQTLDCDYNKISRIDEETFRNMTSLGALHLRHNLINFIHKDAFLYTNNLNTIDFSSNLLKNLPKYLFKNKNISSFSIADNNLEGALSRGTFEGLQLISELDISFQGVTAVEEYAFFGMEKLTMLLLNNNKIRTVSKYSFKTLKNLNTLDLSNNYIVTLDFDKTDLISLETFSLERNHITKIHHDDFNGLKRIYLLDLSNNNITTLEPSAFKFIDTVENFQIINNPLSGPLMTNTFQGLPLLPVLDISCTSLTSLQNGSFNGMAQLQDLKISHSSIDTIDFDAFINTGSVQLIDLSFNKLTEFHINQTHLTNLTAIILNNNYLHQITNDVFKHISLLNKIILSYNSIVRIDDRAFEDQLNLQYLDLSYNYDLIFHISAIEKSHSLRELFLSGIKNQVDFENISSTSLNILEISNSRNIHSISELHLNKNNFLTDLLLKNNSIENVELNSFKNLSSLRAIDLSYNNIKSIQPGLFRDNIFLSKLNLSHNSITSLNYGMFRGLMNLNILDMSFNNIHDLPRTLFYDTEKLKTLIVDYNKITDISEDFTSINLNLLSIGDNPISCEKISIMKYTEGIPLTSVRKEESLDHNVEGITCTYDNHHASGIAKTESNVNIGKGNDKMLIDLSDILLNISRVQQDLILPKDNKNNINNDLLKNIVNKIDEHGINQIQEQIRLKNITYEVANEVERTNIFLERILKAVLVLGSFQSKSVAFDKSDVANVTTNDTLKGGYTGSNTLIKDVNEMKKELLYLENIISEIDKKLTMSRALNMQEKSNKTALETKNSEKSFVFVEVCVSLILILLVCVFVYKFYQTKIFMSSSRSLSTRHITESMDSSNL